MGKFDSKMLAQAAIVSLRRSALLRCINPTARFARVITVHDMLMAYSRMVARNWYVRGVINEIHHHKELDLVRKNSTPDEEAEANAVVTLFSCAREDLPSIDHRGLACAS